MAPGRSVAEMGGDGPSHRLRYAANARSSWTVSIHSVDAGHPQLRRNSRAVTVGAPLLGSMRYEGGVAHSPPTSSDKNSASGAADEDAARHRGEQVASMLYEHRREEKH